MYLTGEAAGVAQLTIDATRNTQRQMIILLRIRSISAVYLMGVLRVHVQHCRLLSQLYQSLNTVRQEVQGLCFRNSC